MFDIALYKGNEKAILLYGKKSPFRVGMACDALLHD